MRESFNEVATSGNGGNGGEFKVKFFQIKPGEKAIVRILVDSIDDLAPYTYHEIELPDGSKKKIGCARSVREDISKCPMCAVGYPVQQVSYIHMLQYTQNPDGTFTVEPKTWGKKPSKSDKSIIGMIANALNEYGGLSDYVSTISRTGEGLNTSYSLKINVPEKVYGPASNYPLDKTLFEGYTEDGVMIKNWSVDEMNRYLTTGELPMKPQDQTETTFNAATAQPAYQNVAASVNESSLPFNTVPPVAPMAQPAYAAAPVAPVSGAAPMPPIQPVSQDVGYPNNVNYGVPVSPVASTAPQAPVRRYN